MRDGESTLETTAGCLAVVVLIPISYIVNGWALILLWGWFIVPTFELDPLAIPQAIGLALIAGFLTHQVIDVTGLEVGLSPANREMPEAVIWFMGVALGKPAIVVVIGWIVNHWM